MLEESIERDGIGAEIAMCDEQSLGFGLDYDHAALVVDVDRADVSAHHEVAHVHSASALRGRVAHLNIDDDLFAFVEIVVGGE